MAGINMLKDKRSIITSQYVNSTEWDITRTEKVVNRILYGCCPNPYVDITYKITLLRKPFYYIWNVIIPCFVLIATILFGFFLPPVSGERVSFTVTLLLALIVFLEFVNMTLPRNSDTAPIFTIFYTVIMIETGLSLGTTCMVLNIHSNSEKGAVEMPNWIRKFFLHTLAKLLCMRRSKNVAQPPRNYVADERSVIIDMNGTYINNREEIQIQKLREDGEHRNCQKIFETSSGISKKSLASEGSLTAILNELGIITSSIRDHNSEVEVQEEWKFLGRVIDRLFFWIFLLTSFLASACILLPAYYVYH